MVVFLANRANLQHRRLHDRVKARLGAMFTDVRRRRTRPQEPGPYRVVGEIDPRQVLDDDCPTATARVSVGFQLQTTADYEYYWFNWIEPARDLLVGWHQDDTHEELGPVHLQVNDGATVVTREPAQFIDSHPLDVLSQRLVTLDGAVSAVEWAGEQPTGFDLSTLAPSQQQREK
jgi:hypothetical protein